MCLYWLQLKTRQGTELLIQSDNESTIIEWYRALQDTVTIHVRTEHHSHEQPLNLFHISSRLQQQAVLLFCQGLRMLLSENAAPHPHTMLLLSSPKVSRVVISGGCACVCVLQAWESDEAIEEDMPESPGAEKHDKEKEHRDSKKGRGACVRAIHKHIEMTKITQSHIPKCLSRP